MALVVRDAGTIIGGSQGGERPPTHDPSWRDSLVRDRLVDVGLMCLPVVVTLVLALAVGRRALWLDEAATLRMSEQSLPDLFRSLGEIDAVHGLYYLLMHGWIGVVGSDPMLLRLPSALAMALACAGVLVIGRRLAGRNAALLAGLVFALLPAVRGYGAEARSYAMTTALVCWGVAWLLLALTSGRRRYWVLYAVTVALGGWWFAYTMLMVPAHAVTLAWTRAGRRVWWRFGVAAGLGTAVVLPWLVIVAGQRGQVSWLGPTTAKTVAQLPFIWTVSRALPAVLLGLALWSAVVAGVVLWLRGRRRDGVVREQFELPHLALPWLVLPAAILVSVSLVIPMYSSRYVLYSAPALALMFGWAVSRWGSGRLVIAFTGCLLVLSVPVLVEDLGRAGKDSWGVKSEILQQHARPGDVLIAAPYFYMSVVDTSFGEEFTRVQGSGPMPTPITWIEAPADVIQERLMTAGRVWLIPWLSDDDATTLRGLLEPAFTVSAEYDVGNATIQMYEPRG